MSMPGGLETKLARGRAIEDPGFQDAVLDQCTALAGDAFGIERMRTKAALAQLVGGFCGSTGQLPTQPRPLCANFEMRRRDDFILSRCRSADENRSARRTYQRIADRGD